MNHQTVIGVFDTKSQARSAKEALVKEGFSKDKIDVGNFGEHGTRKKDYRDDDDSAIGGFFDNLFGNDDKYDENRRTMTRDVASRGNVVTVHTDDMAKAKRAAAILDRFGAIDMDDRYNQYQNKSFDADTNRKQLNDRFGNVDNDGVIEVVKEDVQIGKREVEGGGVTVRSHIVERPVEETVRLRHEEAYVKRTPVDRPATDADLRDQTISVKEKSEEAVVGKTARVVEEIEVGKKTDTRTETIRETARETKVDIDKDGNKVNIDRDVTHDANRDKNIKR
jgi:uncharacterized protein (TIGR02271 family)